MEQLWEECPVDIVERIAEAVSPSPKSLSAMRLVSRSWKDALRYARVAVTPGGARCFVSEGLGEEVGAGIESTEVEEVRGEHRGEMFLHRATCVDLNSRHVSWVMSSKDVQRVAPFFSAATESIVMDNVQKPDVVGELLALKSGQLQNLKFLSLQKSSISDDDLVHAIEALPGLRVLDVSGCMFLRGDFLGALPSLKDLGTLRIGGCGVHVASYHDAWEEAMRHAGRSGKLNELVLHGNVVGDAEIRCLAHVKDTLRYVDVRRCSDVTFDGVYFMGREMKCLETLKVGPVFGVDTRRGVEEVWGVLKRARSTRLVNLEVFGMEDGGLESTLSGRDDRSGETRGVEETTVGGQGRVAHTPLDRRLEMVSFMDTNVCWQRLRGLQGVEYLNVSRSLPVSINSSGNEFVGAAMSYTVAGFDFPRLKTLKACNSSMPWHVVRAVIEGAPGLVHLHLGGWEGLKSTRLMSKSTQIEMIDGFSRTLCTLRQLETLRLPGTHLTDGHIGPFLEASGRGGSRLSVLDLSSNSKLTLHELPLDRWPLGALNVLNVCNTAVKVGSMPDLPELLSLKELYVSGRNVDDDNMAIERFVDFVRRAPKLTTLHMTGIPALSDAALADILEDPLRTSLEDLNIAGCSSLTHRGLEPIAELTRLTKLDVSRLRGAVTDDNLATVLRRNTLSELRASGADLTSKSLEALLRSKLLHYVDVSFCFGMGDDEQCGRMVRGSGSPIKIRLPRGSARLGLFSEELEGEAAEGGGEGVGGALGTRAGRRLAFE